MADKIAQQLRTNVERLGARLSENLAEHSRDLGLVDSFVSTTSSGGIGIGGGGAGKYLENGQVVTQQGIEETKGMLISKRESERSEGLKRVVAMMTKNLPVTSFFPLVTSLLSPTTPLQSRSLISLYIIHCAHTSPELALLSINAYQKDLSDPNPIVRAGSISTLSRMGLNDIRELVGMAVQKGSRDTSWYVRRSSADAVRTLYRSEPTLDNRRSLVPTLKTLLDNANPLTVGSAVTAWEEVCCGGRDGDDREGWELIHENYRRYCNMLMDTEEWGQTVVLKMLTRYGRTFFVDPDSIEGGGRVDPDVELALKNSAPLLNHLNPAVVTAVVKLHYYLSPRQRLGTKIVKPLLRLLHGPPEISNAVLEDCALIVHDRPDLFQDHLSTFFVRFSDTSRESKRTRLKILVALANEQNVRIILKELLTYVKDLDPVFSAEAIESIGHCATKITTTTTTTANGAAGGECLNSLIGLLQSRHEPTIATSILVLRSLLFSSSSTSTTTTSTTTKTTMMSRTQIVTRLVRYLETGKIRDPKAKATVYWLVGQCSGDRHDDGEGDGGRDLLGEGVGPDLVRIGAKNFHNEGIPAKLQLLTLSAKLVISSHLSRTTPHLKTLALLFTYLTTLARYDLTYEVRDRARFLSGLLEPVTRRGALVGGGGGNGKDGEGAKARIMLGEEEFKRGDSVEEFVQDDLDREKNDEIGDEKGLRVEEIRKVLFEGKSFDQDADARHRSMYSESQLGTLSLHVPSKRLHNPYNPSSSSSLSILPPYPTAGTVPPSSIRDPKTTNTTTTTTTTIRSTMQGFGSDSMMMRNNNQFSSGGGGGGRGARGVGGGGGGGMRDQVVLVPTDTTATSGDGHNEGIYGRNGAGRGKKPVKKLDEFFSSEEEEDEEEEEESEEESESEEEQEEEDGEEESSEEGSDEEEEEEEESDVENQR